ncbi:MULTISPECIES: shikimate dehydrogenase [Bacillaceae]|uniref:Shikimate dehydrogenase (NADP(+)) n=1 Tax=Evansella alkalicola TaxID=745819 RepID=A0ABS6JZL3_9BACI|nr:MULTISPECIES: shikimate dehydrogenase [Bacillaceae]MBU9722535.1 shikimate dehydrogenase [Bacillus alkalicola]
MKEVMGVIGYPISHSLSPLMHETAFKELNLEMAYHAFHVHPDRVEEAIAGIRGLGIKGINVTIPHKVSVIPYLDEVDELAKEIGAVNTIVNESGRLKGYNTDGEGFVRSLLEADVVLSDKRVLMVGAGGASKGVSLALAQHGLKEIVITNRTYSKGEELAENCSKFAVSSALSLEEAKDKLNDFDIIINGTSMGMKPHEDKTPISLDNLSDNAVVCDLIYTPLKTKWLLEAELRGATILNGVEMFVYQGALAFEKWTGMKAPIEVMRNAVLRQLGGK